MPEPYRYYYSLFQGLFTAQSLVRKYAIVVEFSLFKVKIEFFLIVYIQFFFVYFSRI
jgi:hypothetical protein